MKITQNIFLYTSLLMAVYFFACNSRTMSVMVECKKWGQNGSFEHVKDGLPYNWQLYTMQTVPSGNFDLFIDTSTFKEGHQSLQFKVHDCDSTGGWRSPGIAKQMKAKPGEGYTISFWTKNGGAAFKAKISGVSATDGKSEVIVQSDELMDDWKYYSYTYTIPEKMNAIRFEFNVLKPGIIWIDDVKIERD